MPTRVVLPWKLSDPCPCGSGRRLDICCHTIAGRPWKRIKDPLPPSPKTNYAHPRCYLSNITDCDRELSKEHYLSQAVLSEIGAAIDVSGMPWQHPDEHQLLPISALTAKVLCRRHNSALHVLDTEAAIFFRALKQIDEDFGRRSLSRKSLNFLISGDAIERWMLKVACGICMSFGEVDGERVKDHYEFNSDKVMDALLTGRWDNGAGLHWYLGPMQFEASPNIQVRLATNSAEKRVVGMRIVLRGRQFDIVFDTANLRPLSMDQGWVRRPALLQIRGRTRCHTTVLTWPPWVSVGHPVWSNFVSARKGAVRLPNLS
jgi:SEC-C motif